MRKKHFKRLACQLLPAFAITGIIACHSRLNTEAMSTIAYDFGGHAIPIAHANELISHYLQTADSNSTHSLFFNADTLRAYLSNPAIQGIKFFLARPAKSTDSVHAITLVIAGVDSGFHYVYTKDGDVYNEALPCPPECPPGDAGHDLLPED